MKVKPEKLAYMREAIRKVVDHAGGASVVVQKYADKHFSQARLLWDLWFDAWFQIRNDDKHPWFANETKKRVVAYDPNFNMYSDDDNDAHIYTALKAIGQELGLWSDRLP